MRNILRNIWEWVFDGLFVDEFEPLNEGSNAYWNGWSYDRCPYPDRTVSSIRWKRGWMISHNTHMEQFKS